MNLSSTMNIAASGVQLASRQLQAGAHNVANLQTDGFESQQVVAETVAGGGVDGKVALSGAPTPMILRDGELIAGSQTDLVSETVNRAAAAASYRANLSVMRTASDLTGDLLDVLT